MKFTFGDVVLNHTLREMSFDVTAVIDSDTDFTKYVAPIQERTVTLSIRPRFPLKRGTPVALTINGEPFIGTVRYRRLTKGVIDGRFGG